MSLSREKILQWCSVPMSQLQEQPDLKIPFRLVKDSAEMGALIARELVDDIQSANAEGRTFNTIIPCGPKCWYPYFAQLINQEKVSLRNTVVFHMDECLDWEGRLLPEAHPFNFRSTMEKNFYGPIDPAFSVPMKNRHFLTPANMEEIRTIVSQTTIDFTLGGWGQDGHIAYNQAKRNPYVLITLDDLRQSSIRIQENNIDTIIALGQRDLGCAFQLVPPLSVTLGIKECLSAKKVRLFSDTGSWKATALRVALFSEPCAEYPMTLLQEHPDAIITATESTATHPIAEHPEWRFF